VTPESKSSALVSIPVERIRQLYVETRSKLDGLNFVIIDDADTMNHVAQNSLLKLLEEPNESICFILTSHSPDKLLPTIRSRTQAFAVPPIDSLESSRLLKALGVTDALTLQRLLYVAEGLPAELTRLAGNASDFKTLSERVQLARQMVEGDAYQRIVTALAFTGDRQSAIGFIDMTLLLLRRSLKTKPDQGSVTRIDRLVDASESIRANGNIKLHLINAVS
jgi:DNA polymerase-3 subunit delta'